MKWKKKHEGGKSLALNDPISGGEEAKKSPMERDKSLLAAEEGTGKTKQLLTDALNNLYVKIRNISRVIWTTNTSFNKGDFTDTEVDGEDDAAVIRLESLSDNDDDIDYETPAEYTLSSASLEVALGLARLKVLTGVDMDWPFTTPANYIYDAVKAEIVGGVGQLKSLAPADATFHANYASNINGNWGDGVLTGAATGGAAVSGGFLDLSYEDVRYVSYASLDNFAAGQTGCVRFTVKPNYSGTPSTQQILFDTSNETDNNNRIVVWQATAGSGGGLFARVASPSGVPIFSNESFGAWSPTAGVEYEIEFNWDVTSGASRMFIDGVQIGSTHTDTGNHNLTGLTTVRFGSNHTGSLTSNFYLKDTIIFDAVQHTANYTPGVAIPQTRYLETDPTIENVSGFSFSSVLSHFVVDSAETDSATKYQISPDNGTTYKWWSGATWVARTIFSMPTAVRTIIGTVDIGNLASLQALDADTYDVSETTSTPGFDIEMDMTNVGSPPDNIVIWGYYNGTHSVNVQIWDYNTTSWVTLGQLAISGSSVVEQIFAVTGTKANKIQNGIVLIRISQPSPGNINHDIILDWVYADAPPSDSWWYDNESNTETEVDTNIGTLAASGTLKWITFLHSNDGSATPIVTNINVAETITYSTDDNLYIDTKVASQIAPVSIAAWLTAFVSATIPGSTDVKLLVSTDNRVTWQKWTGSTWATETSPTLRANAISITDFQTNIPTLALGDGTLDVRLFLYTSVNTVRPTVANINITSDGGFISSGEWESNIYDSSTLNLDWGLIGFTFILNGGTAVLKTKAANSLVELAAASYGTSLTDGDDAGVVGQFIRFKLELGNGGATSPFVDEISVQYVTPQIQDIGA